MPESPLKIDSQPAVPPEHQGAIAEWFDCRTGWRNLMREALYERIPGGARWAYVFGSGLLFLLLSQAVTGIFLAMYYVPSADHAHTTVSYIVKVVTDGAFLRSVHSYGASIMVILLVIHITQTFLYGSYKGKRELMWVSGAILFALVLGMAFTGYLLPWDERAYFATAVGTNAISEGPVIGQWLKLALRGGAGMGTLTLSRFFVLHVFLIPLGLLAFVGAHLFLFRKAGPAGPPSPEAAKKKVGMFYPKQVVMDSAFALLLIIILALLAHFVPKGLGPSVNPADTAFIPRPEWYYRPLFQWLKYWEGPLVVIGILVVPGIIAALFVGLPFYDRRPERRPWRRPIAVGTFCFILGALIVLGIISYRVDDNDPAVAAQLQRQDQAEKQFMQTPFVPETAGGSNGSAAPGAAAANPLVAKGKQIFESQGCVVCHGEGGVGTAMAVKLIGVGQRIPTDQLANLIRHPNAKMRAGGMPSFPLSDDDMKSLTTYLNSLK